MRNHRIGAILLGLSILSGCTATSNVVNVLPQATSAIVGTKVFGGDVGYTHSPKDLVIREANQETRRIINGSREKTQETISNAITRESDDTK